MSVTSIYCGAMFDLSDEVVTLREASKRLRVSSTSIADLIISGRVRGQITKRGLGVPLATTARALQQA